MNWPKILKKHSAAIVRDTSTRQGSLKLERLLSQAHAENELLKKAFAMTQKKFESREENRCRGTIYDNPGCNIPVSKIKLISS
jgi:hypothetical protein